MISRFYSKTGRRKQKKSKVKNGWRIGRLEPGAGGSKLCHLRLHPGAHAIAVKIKDRDDDEDEDRRAGQAAHGRKRQRSPNFPLSHLRLDEEQREHAQDSCPRRQEDRPDSVPRALEHGLEQGQPLLAFEVDVVDEKNGVVDHDPSEQDHPDIGR